MRCLSDVECLDWLEVNNIDAADERGLPEAVGDCEILFAAPTVGRTQQRVARELVEWLGNFENALLWIADWPLYQPEEMAIVLTMRRGYAEHRALLAAPGLLFAWEERELLIAWLFFLTTFGWDGYLFPSPFAGSMLQTSHDDFLRITSSNAEHLALAASLPRKYDLAIYRETLGNR